MRTVGVILIITGVLMFFIRSCSYTREKHILEDREVLINKEDRQKIQWPLYTGGVVALVGLILFYAEKKK